MNRSIFFAILIMAAVTYLIRMLPTVLLRKRLKNRYLLSLLAYLPYAVLGALTFPAVFYSTGNIAVSVAGCAVAFGLAFFRVPMVVVSLAATGTAFLMLLF